MHDFQAHPYLLGYPSQFSVFRHATLLQHTSSALQHTAPKYFLNPQNNNTLTNANKLQQKGATCLSSRGKEWKMTQGKHGILWTHPEGTHPFLPMLPSFNYLMETHKNLIM